MSVTDVQTDEFGLLRTKAGRPIPVGAPTVAQGLDRALAERPEAEALVGRFVRLSFAELEDEINAAAAFIASYGIAKGDRVAASTANHTDIVVAFFAVQRLGAIWVGMNRRYARQEKRFLLEDAGVRLMLADNEGIEQMDSIAAEIGCVLVGMEPGDAASEWRKGLDAHSGAARPVVDIDPHAPAAIAYTSGTTGFPKGAVHSQHTIMTAAAASSLQVAEESSILGTALPLTILNLMILGPVTTAILRCAHVCMDRVDALGSAEWIGKEKISSMSCAPTTAFDMLTNPEIAPASLASLTRLSVGGATVPERLPELYRERFGALPKVGYGLTEAPTGVASSSDKTPRVQGAIGAPLIHLDIAILDTEGEKVANGEEGEICIRATDQGDWADVYRPMLGYWKRPEATVAALRGGWLHTGDVGFLDDQGELHIRDRRSDIIFRGGSNVYPAEVERVLRTDNRVADCAVLGRPDERLGERVVAFVEALPAARDDATLVDDLIAICKDHIAGYKIPVEWHLVEAMPRNAMNKIVKPELKKLLVEGAA